MNNLGGSFHSSRSASSSGHGQRSTSSLDSNNNNNNNNPHNRFNTQAYNLNMANSPTVANLNGFVNSNDLMEASTPLSSQAEECESEFETPQHPVSLDPQLQRQRPSNETAI
ncbi:unnamed protein product [Ambrosiozyma monospora]|uniref:Unnamed protein product n=1 Tax=Ambrosiozyma monospora TaxID=43982 RepID=A0A9W6T569_AMBMO|nr:unnamed protein product [Ambrosiozyma monospora]